MNSTFLQDQKELYCTCVYTYIQMMMICDRNEKFIKIEKGGDVSSISIQKKKIIK